MISTPILDKALAEDQSAIDNFVGFADLGEITIGLLQPLIHVVSSPYQIRPGDLNKSLGFATGQSKKW